MADVIKLVPNAKQSADEALENAMGEYDDVLIIGLNADGTGYCTNLDTYGEMFHLLRLGDSRILDESQGE